MNEVQYSIVKSFLAMGNSVDRIAREWHIDHSEVLKVDGSANYGHYKNGGYVGDMFGNLFGSQ